MRNDYRLKETYYAEWQPEADAATEKNIDGENMKSGIKPQCGHAFVAASASQLW